MSEQEAKYRMSISLNVLNHLGLYEKERDRRRSFPA